MNLSPRWVGLLTGAGVQAVHRSTIGRRDAPDSEIMAVLIVPPYVRQRRRKIRRVPGLPAPHHAHPEQPQHSRKQYHSPLGQGRDSGRCCWRDSLGIKRGKGLSATHEPDIEVNGLRAGVGVAIIEKDVPRAGRAGRISIGAPVPTTGRAGEIGAVYRRGRCSIIYNGQQFAPRGQAPAGVVAAAVSGIRRSGKSGIGEIGRASCRERV